MTTGVVMRRRATTGVDGTRGLGVGGLIRCAGRPREWSCGAVPPQERWHEGGWGLFFLWRLLRCRRGILSHAKERWHEGLGFVFWFGGFFHTLGSAHSAPSRLWRDATPPCGGASEY